MPPVTCWKSAGVMVYKGELEVCRLLPLAGHRFLDPPSTREQTHVSVYIKCKVQCFTHRHTLQVYHFIFFFPLRD